MPLFTKIKFSMIKFYETNENLMSLKVNDLNSVLQWKCKERSKSCFKKGTSSAKVGRSYVSNNFLNKKTFQLEANRLLSQLDKWTSLNRSAVVTWGPVPTCEQADWHTHDWKHYLPETWLAGGNKYQWRNLIKSAGSAKFAHWNDYSKIVA